MDEPTPADPSLEEAPDSLLWIREDGRLVHANTAACRLLGRSREELLAATVFDVAACFSAARWPAVWALLKSEGPVTFDTHYVARDGRPLPVELSARHVAPVSTAGEHVSAWARDGARRREQEAAVLGAQEELTRQVHQTTRELARVNSELRREIEERKEVERTLRAWEEKYRTLAESATDVVWTCDLEGRITYVSPAVQRLLGYDPFDLVTKRLRDLLPPSSAPSALRRARDQIDALPGSGQQAVEMEIPHRLGHPVVCESTIRYLRSEEGRPVGIIGTTRDVSERKRIENALIRSERLAAVGTLAAGIAHEFNNLNTVILGNVDLIASDPALGSGVKRRLEAIRVAALRGATVAQNLLTFGAQDAHDVQSASLTEVAEQTLSLVEEDIQEDGVSLVRRLVRVPATMLSPLQIAQVILNLVTNARHALLARPAPMIEVETGTTEHDVYLKVSDNGCGIPKEHLSRIFTPFFSTKGEHSRGRTPQTAVRGTGLGLSVSLNIVANHAGTLEVDSEENVGSAFTIRLPLRAGG